jgi:ubiquinone/menaquinone biosynthesis C-methylase UbiE
MTEKKTTLPEGLRDTNEWYTDVDPLSLVDHSLSDYVHQHGGQQLLDLGCGTGGYSKVLAEQGHSVQAFDINPEYVKIAQELGVDAKQYDGFTIPLPDNAVDTVFMIEVLEHIENPERILPELHRVARRNVIITVPNNTQKFDAPIAWNHMLEVDHKNFFTVDSLKQLLGSKFSSVEVTQVLPIDRAMAHDLLPRWAFLGYRIATKFGLLKNRHFFRLIANATK